MKATMIQYEGFNYLVIPFTRDNHYGRKIVYHILTNNENWCANILSSIVGYPNVESKGLHDLHYLQKPSMSNALKPYYEVKFRDNGFYQRNYQLEKLNFEVDDTCYYEFTYVEPYDD